MTQIGLPAHGACLNIGLLRDLGHVYVYFSCTLVFIRTYILAEKPVLVVITVLIDRQR